MTDNVPLCCTRDAFRLMRIAAANPEGPDALVYGACALSMHKMENVDPAAVDAKLQFYADVVRARVRGSQPQALLAHLHDVLFEEEDFAGDADNYYSPANNYLPMALETKRGLPITLSLIYKIVAERLGLRVWGVGLPLHFLCGVATDGRTAYVDPAARGRLLSRDEIEACLREAIGPTAALTDDLLVPVPNKHWLTRMSQNLLNIFGAAGKYVDVAAVLEMERLLWPEQDRLRRDLALVLARIGLARPASEHLGEYLRRVTDDPQRKDLEQLQRVLTA